MYPGWSHRIAFPSWIAPLGDVLRAAEALRPYTTVGDWTALLQRLLAGQDASGGIQTACGFAAQAGGRPGALPDLRDVLHVAGWCDKAFRYLATHVTQALPVEISQPVELACTFRKQKVELYETPEVVEVRRSGKVRYQWYKGASWPVRAGEEFWLR